MEAILGNIDGEQVSLTGSRITPMADRLHSINDDDHLAATVIGTSLEFSPEQSHAEFPSSSSRAAVAVVGGSRPHLADETAELLRRRLLSASMVLSLAVGFLSVRGLFIEASFGWPRAFMLVGLIAISVFLRKRIQLSLRQLRAVELLLFGLVGVELVWMQSSLIIAAAAQGEPLRIVGPMQLGILSWFSLILLYGMFIPNNWRRAALMLIAPALAPIIVIGLLCLYDPKIATAASTAQINDAIIIFLIGTAASIYGTHTINALRTEAFKARRFGQYRLKQLLGTGGMGEVYLAEHELLKRPCAIKLIRAADGADPMAVARFEREVRATAKLSHWNTVDVYDYGRTDDGTFYYVMEYLQGLSLAELVKKYGPLPADRAIFLLRQICHALKEAHALGLIHRDIKPANIFAAKQGGLHDIAKLLDFGLVKQVVDASSPESMQLTQLGNYSGSPLYMSPEQATAETDPDTRTDIYSLGAVAYFLLTGQPPFSGQNAIRVMIAHARDEVVPPSRLNPGIPRDLELVVLRCLEKRPGERYTSIDDLELALSKCEASNQWTETRAAEWWNNVQLADAAVGEKSTSQNETANAVPNPH